MPLTEIKQINASTFLGRWALTETSLQLLQHPGLPTEIILPETISHEKRRAEWLASRILAYQLLQKFTPDFYLLLNNETGQPVFENCACQISISHTHDQVAVLVSKDYRVGIDIERIQSKVLRVKDKFLSETEKQFLTNDLVELTIAWSAKETLYKLHGKKNITFSENLILFPFETTHRGYLEAQIQTLTFQQKYTVHFEVENNTVLTYCLHR
ncbi:4'-phosphopantetheinyl transferase superfamily protein [Adhaeribacter swui]|uniref:Enterobactin synthase component D n=1 Tax=Adhaeribacter swui TaxID=2086471 RepID=A0A7G7G426_9BACT|nr:4'-phosphopantetheinyl transferase superfamily protein [Adhaeribacter swui]QNF31910.1 4'-phosphopantetheinyl transferase superfamily protein [Adhaeribacter swui]